MNATSVRRTIVGIILGLNFFAYGLKDIQGQTLVTYKAEDGWTIYGDLFVPDKPSRGPVPGIVLMTEPEWLVRSIYVGLAQEIAKRGMVVLTVDLRGSAQSEGKKPFFAFSPDERKKVQLDVKGAIEYLSSQKIVDPKRIALVGAGISANYAALEASSNPAVQALVFVSGELGTDAREFVKLRTDIPILFAVDPKDKESFTAMSQTYLLSRNEDNEFVLAVGHGTIMFYHTGGLRAHVADWLARNVKGLGTQRDISFKTEDGLSLHGRLWTPDEVSEGSKTPGVVLVHGANHDQTTYYHLAREIVKKGLFALTFDWRGRNEEGTNTSPYASGEKGYLDTNAAIQFLASQNGMDGNHIGLVAATAGNGRAVQAAIRDARVKTIVMLTTTALTLSEESKRYLGSDKVPILAVASSEDVNYGADNLAETTQKTYQSSGNKESEFLLFDHAGRGSEMLKTRPELEAMIVRWFSEKLSSK